MLARCSLTGVEVLLKKKKNNPPLIFLVVSSLMVPQRVLARLARLTQSSLINPGLRILLPISTTDAGEVTVGNALVNSFMMSM